MADEATRSAGRLGLEVVTAGFAGGGPAMRDALVRIVLDANPLTDQHPQAQTEEMRAAANAMHLVYGVGNVAKRAVEWLADCRGVTVETVLAELGAHFAEE